MDEQGTIAAVMDRLDFHERRLVALEAQQRQRDSDQATFEAQQAHHLTRIEALIDTLARALSHKRNYP